MGRNTQHLYRRPNRPGGTYYFDGPVKGKRLRKSLETTVLKEAKLRRDNILHGEIAVKWGGRGRDIKVAEFWPKYETWAKLHVAERTLTRTGQFWQAFLSFTNAKELGDVSRGQAEDFKAHCVNALRWEPKTVNSAIDAVRSVYNRAVELGVYGKDNPFKGVARLPLMQKPPRFLSKDELQGLMDEAERRGRNIHLFVALCAYAGLRNAEAANARWEWVDFDRGCIMVQNAALFQTKNRRFRAIPLSGHLRPILERYQEPQGYIVHPEIEPEEGKRQRYQPRNGFAACAKAAGVPWCTPHTLRHTFASHRVIAGVSLYKVSQWLGHSSMNVTAIYAHLAPQDADIDRF